MSEDVVVALVLCLLGLAAITVAIIFSMKQKVYLDTNNNTVTNIEVPLFGKLKTNTPAIALCFLGVILGYFAYDVTKGRAPTLVDFQGEIDIDKNSLSDISAVLVGMSSGSWMQTSTPGRSDQIINVLIPVPNTWPSYTAYAIAYSGTKKLRPAMIGASLSNPRFKLSIKP